MKRHAIRRFTIGTRRRRRCGAHAAAFVFLDVAVGLALLGVIAFATVASLGHHHRAAQKLADTRAAARAAEDELIARHLGRPTPVAADVVVTLTPLTDRAPAGHVWVRAVARVGMADASVVGLLPAAAAETPTGKAGAP